MMMLGKRNRARPGSMKPFSNVTSIVIVYQECFGTTTVPLLVSAGISFAMMRPSWTRQVGFLIIISS